MSSFLYVTTLFILCGWTQDAFGQQEATECKCWVASAFQTPCPAGSFLPEDTCRSLGCCSQLPDVGELPTDESVPNVEINNRPTCFRALEQCHSLPQCHVKPWKRRICPRSHWRSSRRLCQFRGCCFDGTQTPNCYRAESTYDGKYPTNAPFTPQRTPFGESRDMRVLNEREPTPESVFEVLKKQLVEYDRSVAFTEALGTLHNGDVVLIKCSFAEATQCGSGNLTKEECVNRACCWNPVRAKSVQYESCVRPMLVRIDHNKMDDMDRIRTIKAQEEKMRKIYEEEKRNEEEERVRQEKERERQEFEKQREEQKDEIIPNRDRGIFTKTCRTEDERRPCRSKVEEREDCILNSCCWDSSMKSNDPYIMCHEPAITYEPTLSVPDHNDDSLVEWLPFDPRSLLPNRKSDESKDDVQDRRVLSFAPPTELVYQAFTIVLTCPDSVGERHLCEGGDSREICLSLFCCWVVSDDITKEACVVPVVNFDQQPEFEVLRDVRVYSTEILREPNFWRPSLPVTNLMRNESVRSIFCPKSSDVILPCGDRDIITREECYESGCCWRPWLLLDTEDLPPCQAPTVRTDNVKAIIQRGTINPEAEIVGAKWELWQSWSSCQSVAPCSEEGRQYRNRYCRSPTGEILTAAEDVTKCLGASFEIRTCNDFTGCDATFWSMWSSWSDCSETCQSGKSERSRNCLEPEGCQPLSSPITETDIRACNSEMCEEWGKWIENEDCDAECEGNGTSTRARICDRFAHQEGRFEISETIIILKMSQPKSDLRSLVASQPEAFAVHAEECIVQRIPCHNSKPCVYEWDEWSKWSECDSECGQGERIRLRRCLRKSPDREPIVVNNSSCGGNDGATEIAVCGKGRCERWEEWNITTECNAKCGERGSRVLERNCSTGNFLPSAHPSTCFKIKERCQGPVCSTTAWDKWGSWSATCTTSCSPGIRTRARRCVWMSDNSWVNSELCFGPSIETEACNTDLCKRWGSWAEMECDAKCGSLGVKGSKRICLDVIEDDVSNETPLKKSESFPKDMPKKCHTVTEPCTIKCVIDWGQWGDWSECSSSCEGGFRYRKRKCLRTDGLEFNIKFCPKEVIGNTEQEVCNDDLCQKWGPWNRGECQGPCKGRGVQRADRLCAGRNMEWLLASYPDGGAACFQTVFPCHPPCAVWGGWSNFSECSDPCGPGRTSRHRLCVRGTQVVPATECAPTEGPVIDERNCNIFMCSSYSAWKEEFHCVGKCGDTNATRGRTRECHSGTAPEHCLSDRISCRPRCGAGWGPWSSWSVCDHKCAPGKRTRTRECMNGDEVLDAKVCLRKGQGKREQTQDCNEDFCKSWSAWHKTICPAKCDKVGTQRRNRVCLGYSSSFVPLDCWSDQVSCRGKCRPSWGKWTDWTPCSQTCGPGEQISVRRCTENGQVVNPKKCTSGNKKPQTLRRLTCRASMCDNWSKWKVGTCTVICGGSGTATRQRECMGTGDMYPPNRPDDESCYKRNEQCGTDPCPNKYGPWSEWSLCSSICSPGSQTRTRKCLTNGFTTGDCSSLGPALEKKPCNSKMCSVWEPWEFTTPCSEICGVAGTRMRERKCGDKTMRKAALQRLHPDQCYRMEVSCRNPSC